MMRDGISHRVPWAQGDSKLELEELSNDGEWITSGSQIITQERFPIRLFSQGQIAELSGDNQQTLLQVIDEAAEILPLQTALLEAQNSFYTTRAYIRELDGKLNQEDRLKFEMEDVERKLERFETAGHTAVLTSYRNRTGQSSELERRFTSAEEFAGQIEELADGVQPEDAVNELFNADSTTDQAALRNLESLEQGLQAAVADLRALAGRLRTQIQNRRTELAGSTWQEAVNSAVTNYNTLVDSLENVGVSNLNEYESLVEERQRLDGELKGLELLKQERIQQLTTSDELLQKVLVARRAIGEQRETFLSGILEQNGFVRIGIRPYGNDALAIENSLRAVLDIVDNRFQEDILGSENQNENRGIVTRLLADLPEDALQRRKTVEGRLSDLRARLEAACLGHGSFGGHFNNNLSRQFHQTPSFLDTLLTWFPEDGLNIEYSRTGDGEDFLPINQASAGQRAAAMLAFLLAHGEEPLVLDQPEDDLDNQLIYDLVVRQIRENKLRRQIIAVTHNPNIVVNGDSEMLHVLEFHKGQCAVTLSGSLQEEDIREKVCQVMEGGREAFERRYRRLGLESAPGR